MSGPNDPNDQWSGRQDDAQRSQPTAQWQAPAAAGAQDDQWPRPSNPTEQLPSGAAWDETALGGTGRQPAAGAGHPQTGGLGQPPAGGQWTPQPHQAWGSSAGDTPPPAWGQQGGAPGWAGQQPQYGQPQYGQPGYGQQPQYGQPQYGQPQYGQQPQQQYGQGQYGQQPPRPRSSKSGLGVVLVLLVIVLAVGGVLGFLWPNGGLLRSKTLDQAAVQTGVQRILTENYGVASVESVTCPSGQKVASGDSFACEVSIAGITRQVTITFTDNNGTYEVGRPS